MEDDVFEMEEMERKLPPKWMILVLTGFLIVYLGYDLLKTHVNKNFDPTTISMEGICELQTKDAITFGIPWTIEFEVYDQELMDLYGGKYFDEILTDINYDIRNYYFESGLFETTFLKTIFTNPSVIREIPNKLTIDTSSYYKYICNEFELVVKRTILYKLGLIKDLPTDVLCIEPKNLRFVDEGKVLQLDRKIADIWISLEIARREVEIKKMEAIAAEAELKAALLKFYLTENERIIQAEIAKNKLRK
jgi:hypothetical protein